MQRMKKSYPERKYSVFKILHQRGSQDVYCAFQAKRALKLKMDFSLINLDWNTFQNEAVDMENRKSLMAQCHQMREGLRKH